MSKMKAFSLIEIIVVMGIISVLSAIITPSAFKVIEKAKVSKAVADFKTLKSAVYACYSDVGKWPVPPNRVGLNVNWTVLLLDPNGSDWPASLVGYAQSFQNTGWDGPYIETGQLVRHPWGGLFQFVSGRDWGGEPLHKDLVISFTNWCWPATGYNCGVPDPSARRYDECLDDGNLDTGGVRSIVPEQNPLGFVELGGVLVYDVY